MSTVENNNEVVLFNELNCANGTRIGVATLNAPKTLNGLSLEMTRLLATRIELWAKDPTVAIQLELSRQGIMVQALMADYAKKNPVTATGTPW